MSSDTILTGRAKHSLQSFISAPGSGNIIKANVDKHLAGNMKNIVLSIFLSASYFCSVGQDERTKQIDILAEQINASDRLTLKDFDAGKVYGQTFDGGGIIKVYSDKGVISKIEQVIGLSYGRLTTVVFLKNGQPIQIIDREENFKFKDDKTTFDHSKLEQVFEATIYVFNWDKDDSKVITKGKRVLSEGTCSNFEYEALIDAVKKLMEN
jgi:hypothetical protein